MSTKSHRLTIEGEHRHWAIKQFGDNWVVTADPTPADSNPMDYDSMPVFGDLTDAYDAYVAAEYADNGEHAE